MRIPQRLQLIKYTVLIGMLVSVLLSLNLWGGFRYFPKTAFFDNYTGIPAPYDYLNLAILILLIIIAFLSSKKGPTMLLILFSLYLCADDQNRLQPWFYDYNLILLVLLFFKQRVDEPNNYTSVFISIQVLVALIYIFSGLQKINDHFVTDTFSWMISSLEATLNQRQMNLVLKFGYIAPYLELIFGIGLLIKPFRYIILPSVILMHVLILIFIGPFGKSYNAVVWPWNIIMIAINLLLFANVKQERFFDVAILFKGLCFYIVLTLMLIFPIFSFNNKYDSYLSSSLYSGNTHGCKLILTDSAYHQLPMYVRNFVTTTSDYNILNVKTWALTELGSPCIPEYRVFRHTQNEVVQLTHTSEKDVKMNFTERQKLFNFK